MGLLKRFEEGAFGGEVIHDFGVLHESNVDGETVASHLLLCRVNGAEQIVIRHSRKSFFFGSGGAILIPADKAEEVAAKFAALAKLRAKPPAR